MTIRLLKEPSSPFCACTPDPQSSAADPLDAPTELLPAASGAGEMRAGGSEVILLGNFLAALPDGMRALLAPLLRERSLYFFFFSSIRPGPMVFRITVKDISWGDLSKLRLSLAVALPQVTLPPQVGGPQTPSPDDDEESDSLVSRWQNGASQSIPFFGGDGRLAPNPGFSGSQFFDKEGKLKIGEIKSLAVLSILNVAVGFYEKHILFCLNSKFLSLTMQEASMVDPVANLLQLREARAVLVEIVAAFSIEISKNDFCRALFLSFFGKHPDRAERYGAEFRRQLAAHLPTWESFLLLPPGDFFVRKHTFSALKEEIKHLLFCSFGMATKKVEPLIELASQGWLPLLAEIASLYESGAAEHVSGECPATRKQLQTIRWVFFRLLSPQQRFDLFQSSCPTFRYFFYDLLQSEDFFEFQLALEIFTSLRMDCAAFYGLDIPESAQLAFGEDFLSLCGKPYEPEVGLAFPSEDTPFFVLLDVVKCAIALNVANEDEPTFWKRFKTAIGAEMWPGGSSKHDTGSECDIDPDDLECDTEDGEAEADSDHLVADMPSEGVDRATKKCYLAVELRPFDSERPHGREITVPEHRELVHVRQRSVRPKVSILPLRPAMRDPIGSMRCLAFSRYHK
ncbi:MAG: hypothetical protein LBB14_03320 [Puniceicoccales bacterium]|jgi:hypothetical protein|nr:hypothetical protein [Puniceicoccales bacterium]